MKYGDLDTRMKEYEAVSDIKLTKRTPVILRFDGCHFHTFTKGFDKPYDNIMMRTMQRTMRDLCANIQNCVFGYTQSDEITLVLNDYYTLNVSPWFDNRVEKMCSVGASMASRFFNKNFQEVVYEYRSVHAITDEMMELYESRFFTADFDCRAFNVPRDEVANCLIWRQQDAEKNSIQSLAQSLYTHSELKGISKKDLQNKMFTEKGVNWNDVPTMFKRGMACKKNEFGKWEIDENIPILTQDRGYIEDLVL